MDRRLVARFHNPSWPDIERNDRRPRSIVGPTPDNRCSPCTRRRCRDRCRRAARSPDSRSPGDTARIVRCSCRTPFDLLDTIRRYRPRDIDDQTNTRARRRRSRRSMRIARIAQQRNAALTPDSPSRPRTPRNRASRRIGDPRRTCWCRSGRIVRCRHRALRSVRRHTPRRRQCPLQPRHLRVCASCTPEEQQRCHGHTCENPTSQPPRMITRRTEPGQSSDRVDSRPSSTHARGDEASSRCSASRRRCVAYHRGHLVRSTSYVPDEDVAVPVMCVVPGLRSTSPASPASSAPENEIASVTSLARVPVMP